MLQRKTLGYNIKLCNYNFQHKTAQNILQHKTNWVQFSTRNKIRTNTNNLKMNLK